MASPHELIEHALSIHGDTVYRVALLLTGDDRGVERLMRALVADLLASPPAAFPDEVDLLARLLVADRADMAKHARRRSAARLPADMPPLYRSAFSLPADQRLALGLHLLLGYDLVRLAHVLATDEASTRAALLAAMRALAPAAGIGLTDRTSGDTCISVRDALVDPAGRLRHAPAIRGHLAACTHCRAFDHAWGELSQAVETALRTALRERDLPAALEARLLALARPARRFSPTLRFVLPPLAVLALIAALVLPGITRQPVTVVDRAAVARLDPQELIERALDIHALPPQSGGSIWHARYETFWYFDTATLAPLHADIWLDRSNPSRHRLQLTHVDGGAPYELQLGNGTDRLYYALDSIYSRTLYGGLDIPVTPEQPALLSQIADAPTQSSALANRITYGVWNIPIFYLRQAHAAKDLRVLGRQRDGDRTVQILSFVGPSPMSEPADVPGATADDVTILLALDTEDGRLRSAAELVGPASSTQTSRVTWRLIDEESFGSATDAGSPFEIEQAWNGRGHFPEPVGYQSADPAVPLISAAQLGDLTLLLGAYQGARVLPATPPPGIDRAIMIWSPFDNAYQNPPQAVMYLGPDRRLILRFDTFDGILDGEEIRSASWITTIKPGRARSYYAALEPIFNPDLPDQASNPYVLLDAYGFSRAEIVALIESLRPFDINTLATQDSLFPQPSDDSSTARAELIRLLHEDAVPVDAVRSTSLVFYAYRRQSADPRADPYHRSLNEGLPEMVRMETWITQEGGGRRLLTRLSNLEDPSRSLTLYLDPTIIWSYNSSLGSLEISPRESQEGLEMSQALPQMLMSLLTSQEGTLRSDQTDSGMLISRTQLVDPYSDDYWRALLAASSGPIAIPTGQEQIYHTVEAQLAPDGRLVAIRTVATIESPLPMATPEGGGPNAEQPSPSAVAYTRGGIVLMSMEQIEERTIPIDAAPAMLRDGTLPQAKITRDYRAPSIPVNQTVVPGSLQEARRLVGAPYYALPADMATPTLIELSPSGPAPNQAPQGSGQMSLDTAVQVGLATRTSYTVPNGTDGSAFETQIFQGDADRLGAFLASASEVPWHTSTPLRLSVAGRDMDAWDASDPFTYYLMVEIDGQLLIIIFPAREPQDTLFTLAASLQLIQ